MRWNRFPAAKQGYFEGGNNCIPGTGHSRQTHNYMPILPPIYRNSEMAGIEEEIRVLEEEIQRTPYNKATSKHIGRVKAKIARLKDEAVQRAMKSAGGGEGYSVKKSGDATVVLVGFPSTGKSTLLNTLTGTQSEVAAYAFTTLTVVPGAMEHRGAKIQILDIPGLIAGAAMGKGRGKEVIGVVRSADMIVVLVDVFNSSHVDVLMRESTMQASASISQGLTSRSKRLRREASESMLSEPWILKWTRSGRSSGRTR